MGVKVIKLVHKVFGFVHTSGRVCSLSVKMVGFVYITKCVVTSVVY